MVSKDIKYAGRILQLPAFLVVLEGEARAEPGDGEARAAPEDSFVAAVVAPFMLDCS